MPIADKKTRWAVGILILFITIAYTAIQLASKDEFLFAAIGDYGTPIRGHSDEVADLVKSWNPDFIITLGDNDYRRRPDDSIDRNVGRLYSDYIYPYLGEYGQGSPSGENRFWPSIGNHDEDTGTIMPYLEYFTLPNNERYYDVRIGDIHLFALNTYHEEDGEDSHSIQAKWLKSKLEYSDAIWKIVFTHYPAYASGKYGGREQLRWPFAQWGATAVLAAHVHFYERLEVGGIPYFVNGLGGMVRYPFRKLIPQSIVQYNDAYGAMKITGNQRRIRFEFFNTHGTQIDDLILVKPGFISWLQNI